MCKRSERFRPAIDTSLLNVAFRGQWSTRTTKLIVCQTACDVADKMVADVASQTLPNDYMGTEIQRSVSQYFRIYGTELERYRFISY